MPFEKGREKTGGRRRGTRNKETELKEKVTDWVVNGFEGFGESFEELEPDRKCAVFLKVMEYVLPKKAAEKPEDEQGTTGASDLLRERAEYESDD